MNDKGILLKVIIGLLVLCVILTSGYFAWTTLAGKASESRVEKLESSAQLLADSLSSVTGKGQAVIVSEEQKRMDAVKARLAAGDTEGIKVVFMTFDDGPSEYSNAVLDLLNQYHIKGTFFTRGREGDVAVAAYKRIVEEGHTLANHTYNHSYDLYNRPSEFYADVNLLADYQKQLTGAPNSMIFRFPGGSLNANKTCVRGILDMGYNYADWNVSSGDAAPTTPTPEAIANNIIGGVHQFDVSVVLCHGEVKENTRKALPQVFEQLKGEGYTFLPMDAALNIYPRQLEVN